jgi:hypothetical protein
MRNKETAVEQLSRSHTAIDVPVSPRSARRQCLPMFIEFFSFAAIEDEEQKC